MHDFEGKDASFAMIENARFIEIEREKDNAIDSRGKQKEDFPAVALRSLMQETRSLQLRGVRTACQKPIQGLCI